MNLCYFCCVFYLICCLCEGLLILKGLFDTFDHKCFTWGTYKLTSFNRMVLHSFLCINRFPLVINILHTRLLHIRSRNNRLPLIVQVLHTSSSNNIIDSLWSILYTLPRVNRVLHTCSGNDRVLSTCLCSFVYSILIMSSFAWLWGLTSSLLFD